MDLLEKFTISVCRWYTVKQTTTSKFVLYLLFLFVVYCYVAPPIINHTNPINPNSSGVLEYDCVDAWIIIGGDRDDHDSAAYVRGMTDWVYDRVIDCGIEEDDIYYCCADINDEFTTREDNITSLESI